MHWPVTVSLNTCSQKHVQIKYSLGHLQDLIPTLTVAITYIFYTSYRLVRADYLFPYIYCDPYVVMDISQLHSFSHRQNSYIWPALLSQMMTFWPSITTSDMILFFSLFFIQYCGIVPYGYFSTSQPHQVTNSIPMKIFIYMNVLLEYIMDLFLFWMFYQSD